MANLSLASGYTNTTTELGFSFQNLERNLIQSPANIAMVHSMSQECQ